MQDCDTHAHHSQSTSQRQLRTTNLSPLHPRRQRQPRCPELVSIPRLEPIDKSIKELAPVRQSSIEPVERHWLINFSTELAPIRVCTPEHVKSQPTTPYIMNDSVPLNALPNPLSPSSPQALSNSLDLSALLVPRCSSPLPTPMNPSPPV